jgi:murein L,D-transpeptidase YcbB/YkuD
MSMRNTRTWAAAVALAMLGAGRPVAAQDWSPFAQGPGAVASTQSYDREFTREWEANPPKGYATLSPANIEATKAAIRRYQDIVAKGGWPLVPEAELQSGSNGAGVEALRRRLTLSGDLREESSWTSHFDFYLEKAVKRFQASNGLTPTGIVDKRTAAALNVPAAARLKQLQANLGRLQELSRSAGKRYVLVNIPAAQVEAIEGDKVVSRHSGVVGKMDRPSPLLHSAIYQINFNPVWTLPPTVISKDLIPKGRDLQKRGRSVLVDFGIDAYDGAGKKLDPTKIDWNSSVAQSLTYRQQPGKENPLGFMKINFDNAYSVYLHDSPSEGLFGRNFRAASSGCVRVQGIEHLAAWLLADNGWTEARVLQMKQTGERVDINLKRQTPIIFGYLTAWATEDGVVQFRRDLYLKDGVGQMVASY